MEIFVEASRKKFRFSTPQGNVSVEDLWELPLESKRMNQANLNDIAVDLDEQIQKSGTTKNFIKTTTKTNDELKSKFEIVLHVIKVKQEEEEAATAAHEKSVQKQRILELLAKKKDEALAGKSEEELQELLKNL